MHDVAVLVSLNPEKHKPAAGTHQTAQTGEHTRGRGSKRHRRDRESKENSRNTSRKTKREQ